MAPPQPVEVLRDAEVSVSVSGWDRLLENEPDLGIPQEQPTETIKPGDLDQVLVEDYVKYRKARVRTNRPTKPAGQPQMQELAA